MTTYYTQKSDVWSNNTSLWNTQSNGLGTWGIPANNDVWIIQTGHTVTFNVDSSSLLNGYGQGTIQTGAVLQFSTDPGTYYLKQNGTIYGPGTFKVGTAETPYPTTCTGTVYFVPNYRFESATLQIYASEAVIKYANIIGSGAKAITAVDQNYPCKITTSTAHGFSANQNIVLVSLGGMTELNNTNVLVADANPDGVSPPANSTTFTIKSDASTWALDLSALNTYTTGGYACPQTANTAGNTTLTIDQDLTAAGYPWNIASARVCILNSITRARSFEYNTISSITPTTIVLNSALSATKYAGAYVFIYQRNFRIMSNNAFGANSPIIYACNITLNCEMSNIHSSSTSYPIYSCAGTINGGSYLNSERFLYLSSGLTINNGMFLGCYYLASNTSSCTVNNGIFAGIYGLFYDNVTNWTVNNGLFVGNNGICGAYQNNAPFIINGGTFIGNCAASNQSAWSIIYGGGGLTSINGGVFAYNGVIQGYRSEQYTIKNATFVNNAYFLSDQAYRIDVENCIIIGSARIVYGDNSESSNLYTSYLSFSNCYIASIGNIISYPGEMVSFYGCDIKYSSSVVYAQLNTTGHNLVTILDCDIYAVDLPLNGGNYQVSNSTFSASWTRDVNARTNVLAFNSSFNSVNSVYSSTNTNVTSYNSGGIYGADRQWGQFGLVLPASEQEPNFEIGPTRKMTFSHSTSTVFPHSMCYPLYLNTGTWTFNITWQKEAGTWVLLPRCSLLSGWTQFSGSQAYFNETTLQNVIITDNTNEQNTSFSYDVTTAGWYTLRFSGKTSSGTLYYAWTMTSSSLPAELAYTALQTSVPLTKSNGGLVWFTLEDAPNTPTVTIAKNDGSYSAATNSITTIGGGVYSLAVTADETDTEGQITVKIINALKTYYVTTSVLSGSAELVIQGTVNTVSSNSDFTLTSSQMSTNNNDYDGMWLVFISGNNKRIPRIISTYTGGTKRVQFTGYGVKGAYPQTVSPGDKFQLLAGST